MQARRFHRCLAIMTKYYSRVSHTAYGVIDVYGALRTRPRCRASSRKPLGEANACNTSFGPWAQSTPVTYAKVAYLVETKRMYGKALFAALVVVWSFPAHAAWTEYVYPELGVAKYFPVEPK